MVKEEVKEILMVKETKDQRLKFNLDSLERNVNKCSPLALEDAANVGADIEKMGAKDLSTFRVLVSRYREDCTCLRIPASTKAKAEKAISEIKSMIETAKETATPTVKKIKAGIAGYWKLSESSNRLIFHLFPIFHVLLQIVYII